MTQYNTKAEVKDALKVARTRLSVANLSGDRNLIQRCLKNCQDLQDVLHAWKGK